MCSGRGRWLAHGWHLTDLSVVVVIACLAVTLLGVALALILFVSEATHCLRVTRAQEVRGLAGGACSRRPVGAALAAALAVPRQLSARHWPPDPTTPPPPDPQMVVDTTRHETMHVTFNVTFPALPCEMLILDVADQRVRAYAHLDQDLIAPPLAPACPACDIRRLRIRSSAPDSARWTITCACTCAGETCPCGMDVPTRRVRHVWAADSALAKSISAGITLTTARAA